MKHIKRNRILIFGIIAAVLCASMCGFFTMGNVGGFSSRSVNAEAKAVLMPDDYWFFDLPKSIFVDENIRVLDDNTLHTFSLSGKHLDETEFDLSSGTVAAAYYGQVLIQFMENSLKVGEIAFNIAMDSFAVADKVLYVAEGSYLHIIDFATRGVTSVDVNVDIIYVSNIKDTGYFAAQSGNSTVLFKAGLSGNITTLCALPLKNGQSVSAIGMISENEVAYASGNAISVYNIKTDSIIYRAELKSAVKYICAYQSRAFYLSADGTVGAVSSSSDAVIIYNGSVKSGHLQSPVGIISRKNMLCVNDLGNERIAVYRSHNETTTLVGYIAALAVTDIAIGYEGNIYVAASQTVKVYSPELEPLVTDTRYKIEENISGILSIAVDFTHPAMLGLYAVANDGSIADITGGKTVNGDYIKVRASLSSKIYALKRNGEVVCINKASLLPDASFNPVIHSGAVDFAVDAKDNIFIATDTKVTEYKKSDNNYVAHSEFTDTKKIGGITVATADGADFVKGSLLITDAARNCISVADGLTAHTLAIDFNADYYDQFDVVAPVERDSRIIYRVKEYGADVYDVPSESPAIVKLSSGSYVIVVDSVTYDNAGYWCVLVDNSAGIAGFYGFVRSDSVTSDSVIYSSPISKYGTLLASNTAIKKFPAAASATLFNSNSAGEKFELLSFVGNYNEVNGSDWCRVAITNDGFLYEGYVSRREISVGGNVVITEERNMPKINAHIKSTNDNEEFIPTYDGESEDDISAQTINVLHEIEVIGTFALSNEFTQIKYAYIDDNGQTIVRTCYVKTAQIYYSDITVYQIVAIIAIIIVVVLCILLIIIKKRKDSSIKY